MKVTLQIHGHLREYYPRFVEPVAVEVPAPATVAEILKQVGIPPEIAGAVYCNGEPVAKSHQPGDGDELLILSPMSGG